jgi:ZIP family zinc transporter
LHNATEGFGIVGPLAAEGVRPSWKWLGLAGLIAGGRRSSARSSGPASTSEILFVGFLALAAGAIVYVVAEILNAGRRLSQSITLWGVFRRVHAWHGHRVRAGRCGPLTDRGPI